MSTFIFILTQIILPIFLMILTGYVLQKRLHLNISTLSKIQIYVFIPALVFSKIYTSTLSNGLIGSIVCFTTTLFGSLMVLSTLVSRLLKFQRPKEKAFINSVVLRNTGNYGIPLIMLLYQGSQNEYAISVHMIAVITSTVLMYTVGLYNASSGSYSGKQALLNIVKIPTIYSITLAAICKTGGLVVPIQITSVLGFFSEAVVPVALIALGAQLAETKFSFVDYSVYLGNFIRLIISPAVAYMLAAMFKLDSISTGVMVIGAATPTAINSLMLALEFKGDADYASQTILTSTLLSAFTISIVIMLIQ